MYPLPMLLGSMWIWQPTALWFIQDNHITHNSSSLKNISSIEIPIPMVYSGTTVRRYITRYTNILEETLMMTKSIPSKYKRKSVLPLDTLCISKLVWKSGKQRPRIRITSSIILPGKANTTTPWKVLSNITITLKYPYKCVLNMSGINYQASTPKLVMSLKLLKWVMQHY